MCVCVHGIKHVELCEGVQNQHQVGTKVSRLCTWHKSNTRTLVPVREAQKLVTALADSLLLRRSTVST